MAILWNNWQDDWINLGKVVFDPSTKIITVLPGVTEINVGVDIFSAWKKWAQIRDNTKHLPALEAVGGNPTIGQNRISSYYFLINGWKLRPQEADHTLSVDGILIGEGGTDPYIDTIDNFNVRINATIPLQAEFIVAQLPEIEFASFQNAVWYDTHSIFSGTAYPMGTRQQPVNNLEDALSILSVQGFARLGLLSNVVVGLGHNIEDMEIFGLSQSQTLVTILPEADTARARFVNVSLEGELDGETVVDDSEIRNLHYVNGVLKRCTIRSDATITVDGNAAAEFIDCNSGPPESMEQFPLINMGGAGQSLSVRNYNGKIKIINKTGPEKISMDINSGSVVIDETVTNGIIAIRGLGKVEDNSTEQAIVISEDMINRDSIANAVWNAQLGINPEDIARTILLSIQSELNNLDVNIDDASIANAVWNAVMGDFTTTGTTGHSLSTASTGGVDVNVLADAVWDHTTGQQVSTDTDRIKNIEEGNWKIVGKQMVFFDLQGIEMFRFNLKDKDGNASNENVFERERV